MANVTSREWQVRVSGSLIYCLSQPLLTPEQALDYASALVIAARELGKEKELGK